MKNLTLSILVIVLLSPKAFSFPASDESSSDETLEIRAEKYLKKINDELIKRNRLLAQAVFDFLTNVTEENKMRKIQIATDNAKYLRQINDEIYKNNFHKITDNNEIKRQIKFLTKLGYKLLSDNEYNELMLSINNMQSNYAKIKICSYNDKTKCDLSLEPEIELIIENSRDPEELKYYWKQWYDLAGTPTRKDFEKYIELSRKAAKLNNFTSMAELWIDEYEDPKFIENLDKIYEQILPFYKKLHAYARYKLHQKYGNEILSENGNIPMHLLGNLWGQSWDEIVDIIVPYSDIKFIDITKDMINQGYTPLKMFKLGDEFFQSLNMTKLPQLFWDKSYLEKPKDGREFICHASAHDMYSPNDVRIKQCTKITMGDLYVVHHELGHIQYYLQYQHLPVAFRRAPNPGFHEAVGDVIALSVSTPKHLEKIGLLKDFEYNEKRRINELFRTAMKKIIFLPFSYTLDKYRYAVFRNEIPNNELNCAFWKMRSKYSGIEPPVERTENDFDPPAKYHVTADVEYLRYFTSHIFQFQFLKAACKKAGQLVLDDPKNSLDNCDIHGSAEAGNAFKQMLALGASKHWKYALEIFTGEKEMDASALLEYFEPLQKFLNEELKRLNITTGWELSDKCK